MKFFEFPKTIRKVFRCGTSEASIWSVSMAIEALLPYKDKIHTITADNGKEFARPYHSWERGANENTNGLIRQYIPKGTDFSELTDGMLAEIEWKLNHRPRRSLGYRTPLEYCKQLFNFDF